MPPNSLDVVARDRRSWDRVRRILLSTWSRRSIRQHRRTLAWQCSDGAAPGTAARQIVDVGVLSQFGGFYPLRVVGKIHCEPIGLAAISEMFRAASPFRKKIKGRIDCNLTKPRRQLRFAVEGYQMQQ